MTLLLFCPKVKSGGKVDVLKCIYICSKHTAKHCGEYKRIYPQLSSMKIEEKYQRKYGDPQIPVPVTKRKKKNDPAPTKPAAGD